MHGKLSSCTLCTYVAISNSKVYIDKYALNYPTTYPRKVCFLADKGNQSIPHTLQFTTPLSITECPYKILLLSLASDSALQFNNIIDFLSPE